MADGPEGDAVYAAADFAAPQLECDLVMKGGVTSGVVYPYAVLELAKAYRFRSIGGTSAGGIAAAFAAAAEYARTVRNDPEGFLRLKAWCDALPPILGQLFQPDPAYRTLMAWLLRAQASRGLAGVFLALARCFWGTAAASLVLGAGLLWLLGGGIAGALAGAVLALVLAFGLRAARLLAGLPKAGFGLCSGLTQPGAKVPGLTDWIHAALQDIAFGPAGRDRPLTFGDLSGPDPARSQITLRMVTTNLSMSRPHTLPDMKLWAYWRPERWARLFPAAVVDHLTAAGEPRLDGCRPFPKPEDLPVLVAVRMSLSFPLLFQAIPMTAPDPESAAIARRTGVADPPILEKEVWFSDGGISSNFPIHLFDALLPTRPTFAISLDPLPPEADPQGERVRFPEGAGDAIGVPVQPIASVGAFVMSLFDAAKDWQDQLLAGMPGQRERIARVYLAPDQGGLNLTMDAKASETLMAYGRKVGRGFASGAMDFDEHRWRRALMAYQNLEQVADGADTAWNAGGFGAWLRRYLPRVQSYKLPLKTRREVRDRLQAFVDLDAVMDPPLAGPGSKFPKPPGRMRITPDP